MEFAELADTRRRLESLSLGHVPSLAKYHDADSNGFFHRLDDVDPGDFSKSSTATCVLSLVAARKWNREERWVTGTTRLAKSMLRARWASAGLSTNNVFTTAFILEAVTGLERVEPMNLGADAKLRARLQLAESILIDALRKGSACLEPYPPSAYLTQLAIRTLLARRALPKSTARRVREWSEAEVARQLSLRLSRSKSADPYQLAYALITMAALTPSAAVSPQQNALLDAGLSEFFAAQLPDGSWPRSQPLFHYPEVGDAYCFEYELLVQLVSERNLELKLLGHLGGLRLAAIALETTTYVLGPDASGWSSGHHPQIKGPESWSTASAYHFAHAFERLLAEAARRAVFAEFGQPYTAPSVRSARPFAVNMLDSPLPAGVRRSLKRTLEHHLVNPLIREEQALAQSGRLSDAVPTSVILFGPPGTSKTDLTRHLATALGWPRLKLDPSHFVKSGMDLIYAEADRIFERLAMLERVVVLFDEFDEMVRAREDAPEVESRFLTTAMLPKLSAMRDAKRLVFVVATNHIENFDVAIRRRGRFDLIVQVMPPSAAEKLRRWPLAAASLRRHGLATTATRKKIAALTFDEFRALARQLEASTRKDAPSLVERAYESCTLMSLHKGTETWAEASANESNRVQLA